MKLRNLFFSVSVLTAGFLLGLWIGRDKGINLSEIQTNTYNIYKSAYDNPKKRDKTLEELDNFLFSLLHLIYFGDEMYGYKYNYHKIEEVILECLQHEINYCNKRTSNVDTSPFLEAHLSAAACLISSSEFDSNEQNRKIARLAVMLKHIKNINQQVFEKFLKSHVNYSYYPSLIKSLIEINAIEDGAKISFLHAVGSKNSYASEKRE